MLLRRNFQKKLTHINLMNTENLNKEKNGFRIFLKKNLKLLITLCLVIILIGIFFIWLDYSEKSKRTKSSESFIESKILLSEKNYSKSLEILENIINWFENYKGVNTVNFIKYSSANEAIDLVDLTETYYKRFGIRKRS